MSNYHPTLIIIENKHMTLAVMTRASLTNEIQTIMLIMQTEAL